MAYYKKFKNGLRMICEKIDGLTSVSLGVLVKTGSIEESQKENGISHFIEHTVFKGTEKRSSFEISDSIDRMGAQINAFTSKEITCYYTKSTAEHAESCAEVLSDIFFNSVFDEAELQKEKGVILEEINMGEDNPEDLCLDLLAESYYGKTGLGRPILGSAENVKSFTRKDIKAYMDEHYTADNVVISFAGNIEEDRAEEITEKYFAEKFTRFVAKPAFSGGEEIFGSSVKVKKIEQAHIGLAFKAFSVGDKRGNALNIANTVLGGGMSSRLFQKIREELGLCYTVYSYPSLYKNSGALEIYSGVNVASRDLAYGEILKEIKKFAKDGVTESEFLRGKEQIKSSFIIGRESTASQMLLYGKYLLFMEEVFDFDKKLKEIEKVSLEEVNRVVKIFDTDLYATSTVGPSKKALAKK